MLIERVRGRRRWILGGGAAASVAVVLTVALFVFNGRRNDDPSSPKAAVSAFLNAAKRSDTDAMARVSCKPLAGALKGNLHFVPAPFGPVGGPANVSRYSVSLVNVHGSTADVTVTEKNKRGDMGREAFITKKESGHWTVCGIDHLDMSTAPGAGS
ncbi:MAG: hypothetical protein DLM58_20320 [Pseudonocardiales bacterium]|nr:MAG: hypothetical protein DLM58_20320 [Pseudonocardiales bacterium]